jgi:SAM-dependent methyltransferase
MVNSQRVHEVGSRTLEIFEDTHRINQWIYSRFAADLGQRVLEVGSGTGNLTHHLVDRELVIATELEESHLSRLRERFSERPNVRVQQLNLESPGSHFSELRLDSILSVNVLEHIKDDNGALRWIRAQLVPGGKLCIYVPALPALYGSLDEALGHYRRYQRAELISKLEAAGFRVLWCRGMNVAGIPGWFLSGRVLKRRQLSARQVRLYDRLVPLFRLEDHLPLPIAMNLTACAVAEG